MNWRRPLVLFFLLAYALTWSRWLPEAAAARGFISFSPPTWWQIVAGYGPAIAAVIVTAIFSGRDGLGNLFGRLVRWRVNPIWYAVALLVPPGIILTAIGLHRLAGGQASVLNRGDDSGSSLVLQGILLLVLFLFGFDGLGEELGWRGFALPRLQTITSPLMASLVLGLLWGIWHLPYALTPGSALAAAPIGWFLVDLLAASILYTWIFNGTGGSVLLTTIFHAAGNTFGSLVPVLPATTSEHGLFMTSVAVRWAVALVIILFLWQRYLGRVRSRKVPPVELDRAAQ